MRAAWLLPACLTVAACGSGGASPDASSLADAMIDAGTLDASLPDARTVATVEVQLAGSPKAGALVVFHAANGDPTEPVTTNAEGLASAELAPGSTISVGLFAPIGATGDFTYRLVSIHGAQPEDILVELDRPAPPSGDLGSVDLTLSAPGVVTADVYGCEARRAVAISTAGPTPFAIDESCLDADGKLSLFAIGQDATGAPAGFSSLKGLAPVPGSTFAFAAAFTPGVSTTYSYTNGFAIGPQVEGRVRVAHVIAGRLFLPRAGAPVTGPAPIAFGLGPVDEGHAAVDGIARIANLELDPATIGSYSRSLAAVVGPPAATVDVDAPSAFLAGISGRMVTRPAPDQVVVSWTSGVTGIPLADADGGLVHTVWTRAGNVVSWTAVVPPGATTVTYPTLPDAMASWRPTATDTASEQIRVLFSDSSLVTAAGFRRHVDTTMDIDRREAFNPPLVPPALVVRVSDSANEVILKRRR